jgi:hypothetical protein
MRNTYKMKINGIVPNAKTIEMLPRKSLFPELQRF